MNVFFFGDSIFFGQYVPPHKAFVTRIAAELDKLQANEDIIVINSSINGDTTRMALERMPHDVQSHGVSIIAIQFGLNDCNYWESDNGHPRVSRKAFEANLQEIIDRAFIFGAKKVLLNTNHPTPRTSKFEFADISYQESNQSYNESIRAVAAQTTELTLIDIEKRWSDLIQLGEIRLEDLLLPDGVHLSKKGHDEYFSQVMPIVLEALQNL